MKFTRAFKKIAKDFDPEMMETTSLFDPSEVKVNPAIELGAKLFGYYYDKVLHDPANADLEPMGKVRLAYNLADKNIKAFLPQSNMDFYEENFNPNISEAQARFACDMRTGIRWYAWNYTNDEIVEDIHRRYYSECGNPNGPSFEYIENKNKSRLTENNLLKNTNLIKEKVDELKKDLAVSSIFFSADKPNKHVNNKLNISFNQEQEKSIEQEIEERKDLLNTIFKKGV